MMTVFVDVKGIVYQHRIPRGQTVNFEYYCTILQHLKGHIQKKHPNTTESFIMIRCDLTHLHTQSHSSKNVRSKLCHTHLKVRLHLHANTNNAGRGEAYANICLDCNTRQNIVVRRASEWFSLKYRLQVESVRSASDRAEAVFLSSVTHLHCYACLALACLARVFVLMWTRLYIPDFIPCDFWLFPLLKFQRYCQQFITNKEVVQACQQAFLSLSAEEFEKTFFHKWIEHWHKSIANNTTLRDFRCFWTK